MKHLYVALCATSLLVSACGGSKGNKNNIKPAPKTTAGENTGTRGIDLQGENLLMVNAIEGFKAQGYNPNAPENKALADEVAGAEVTMEQADETSKKAKFTVVLGSTCEMVSKSMHGNQYALAEKEQRSAGGKGTPAEVTPGNGQKGSVAYPAGYADLENKCVGANGGCDHIAVLFSKRDINGGKPAQVVIAFTMNNKGGYDLVGWPTAKKGAFKSVTAFVSEAKHCGRAPETKNAKN